MGKASHDYPYILRDVKLWRGQAFVSCLWGKRSTCPPIPQWGRCSGVFFGSVEQSAVCACVCFDSLERLPLGGDLPDKGSQAVGIPAEAREKGAFCDGGRLDHGHSCLSSLAWSASEFITPSPPFLLSQYDGVLLCILCVY